MKLLALPAAQIELSIEGSPSGWVWSHQEPLVLQDLQAERRLPDLLDLYQRKGFRSLIVLPMTTTHHKLERSWC